MGEFECEGEGKGACMCEGECMGEGEVGGRR
jgi:hypothetical protein